MKDDTETPVLQSRNGIPEHPIWKIMKAVANRPISQGALGEMRQFIETLIETKAQEAAVLLDSWNAGLDKRLQRKRISAEIIKEVLSNGKE